MTFPGGSGDELAGIVDMDEDSNSAPVVVFSHCFTCNKDLKAIVRIARGLTQHGITVLRYDMTGLGGSAGDFSETNFTTNLADLRSAVMHANQTLGPVRGLIGHSFGGAASMMAAATRDSRGELKDLGFLATLAAPSDTQHLGQLLLSMDPRIDSEGIGEVTIGGRTWTIRKQMVDDFTRHQLSSRIGDIDVPTMVFHSPFDATVGFDHAVRIVSLMNTHATRNPLASLITLPNADHLLTSDAADLEYVTSLIGGLAIRHSR